VQKGAAPGRRVPARNASRGYPKSESNRINFLSHKIFSSPPLSPSSSSFSAFSQPSLLSLPFFRSLLFLLRFLVRQNNPDVDSSVSKSALRFARAGLHPFESRTLTDDRFLHDQAVRFQVRVVFRVRDRALERLINQDRGLLRCESENVQRGRNRQTLDLSRDFARLNAEILAYLCIDLTSIYFKLTFEASTWSRSPTLIFPSQNPQSPRRKSAGAHPPPQRPIFLLAAHYPKRHSNLHTVLLRQCSRPRTTIGLSR